MDNKQLVENFEDMNLFLESVGIDEKTKEDHFNRLGKVILASVAEKLDQATSFKDKLDMPEIKSSDDFYVYFEKYIDRETISKIINEETQRVFGEYFKSIAEKLPQ